ncbi:GDSL-type esterase/lipase family protein [Horticoccus sp. 23ND18S-11]|uniref:GDSL-type esterase/lipase family protein n=1 Tax=Horticoccus sp. 23ND18S-11 TaxID=3391832 RepID=UPI0039C9AE2F
MKTLTALLAVFAFLAVCGTTAAEASFSLVPAQECRPRQGWPNFLAKAATPGAQVRIAYFGGSITAQSGWRPKTLAHFQKTYPQATFTEINAAIGGTGSDLGVFRLKNDVLAHRPDLVLVEFAVNDGGASPEQIHRCMEGIVRQIWRAAPQCDIGFVYTLTEALAPAMLEGKFQRSASAMEQLADHYGIPSIHLAMEVAQLARAGRLVWKAPLPKTEAEQQALSDKVVFAPDSVHPHVETGHEMYLQAVVRSLEPIRAASQAPAPHALRAPFIASNYEQAQLIPISAATLSRGIGIGTDPAAVAFAKRWVNRLPAIVRASEAGDTLTFSFKGTRCAIYDVIGPDCGQVRITLDDRPPEAKARFDAYCTYHRLSTFMVGTELPDTIHTVRIELLRDPPDKAKILAQRNQTIDDPKRYAGLSFFPGAILLVGELVKP